MNAEELRQTFRATGTYDNPLQIDTESKDWLYPAIYQDRPYVYVRSPSGVVTKVYRSYSDYCD